MAREAVIVDAVRTASGKGKPGGALSGVPAVTLLATVLQALLDRTGLDPERVDDVIGGCVSQVGEQAFNITRNAVLAAGLPETVPATTIDRQCGSSQQAVHFAAQGVIAGAYDAVVACGIESMSRVPMFSSLQGADINAPLRGRYPEGLVSQGISAELLAARWKLSRDELDEFAARSHRLAGAATFDAEIVPIGEHRVDETVRADTTVAALAGLKPAFYDPAVAERFPEIGWHITPGNSSPLTDGASAILITSAELAERLDLPVRARFVSFSVVGSDPLLMLTGVIPASQRVLDQAGLTLDQIDVYEVNEAFAPVPLVWLRELNADPDRLNPSGGAIALGHPLGATGSKLLTTLVHHLSATGGRYGLQAICEGGGMANALIVEGVR